MEVVPYVGFTYLDFYIMAMILEDQEALSGEFLQDFVRVPGKKWSLVQTRPRNEKFTAQNLLRQGVAVYLPLLTKVEIHNRSKRTTLLPMFSGYLFACPTLEEETLIRREKCVWNLKVLGEAEEEILLQDLKLVRQAELLSREHKLIIKPGIRVGDTVVLKKGPFKGHDVIVAERDGEATLVVNLNFLGRNILIRCSAEEVEV